MRISDIFSRGHSDEPDPDASGAPDPDAAGADVSSPLDTRGEGTVTLADRTAPGGQGSPDTNQGKTEPMPPTPGHADPALAGAPGTTQIPLEEMNVGAANPQIAHPTSLAPGATAPVATAPSSFTERESSAREAAGTLRSTGPDSSAGEAHRAPGEQGRTGPAEQISTDVRAGAAWMAGATPPGGPVPVAGDTHGVEAPSGQAATGTSEELPVAQGVRTATDTDPSLPR